MRKKKICRAMSRLYLYLIFLLIYTVFVSSSDFEDVIRRDSEEKPNKAIRLVKKKSRLKDKNRVHFDVASFIKKPDDIEIQKPHGIGNSLDKRRKISEDYDYRQSKIRSNIIKKRRNKNAEADNYDRDLYNAPEFNYDTQLSEDITNSRQPKLTRFDDDNAERHHQELIDNSSYNSVKKKCSSIKNTKFPHFSCKSHNDKKKKKHKLYCFNYPKKVNGFEVSSNGVGKSTAAILTENNNPKILKTERTHSDKRQIPSQEIHNSRDYYKQKSDNFEVSYTDKAISDIKENDDVNRKTLFERSPIKREQDFSDVETKNKRSEDDDSDRRLKILDQIQRRIDNVEIHVPF